MSSLLKKAGIPHNVLNARYHDVEAQIIAEAGKSGAVTIATNMAGRGTDIKLGGNLEARLGKELLGIEDPHMREEIAQRIEKEIEEDNIRVKEAGGLYVIGTERHESRRIDNQLRGRSGRQGDPGSSKFFLSLEDDLMRIFGAERLDSTLRKLGIEEGEAITHPWVNKALEKAQMKVESRNYDIRKHLLKFDDVMNDQRKVIYSQRRELMEDDLDCSADIRDMCVETVQDIIFGLVEGETPVDMWDFNTINDRLAALFGPNIKLEPSDNLTRDNAVDILMEEIDAKMQKKEQMYTPEIIRYMERTVLLRLIDQYWKEHLLNLDRLRQGINLRAYGQRDPLNEYKQEAFNLFEGMSRMIREEAVRILSLFELSSSPERAADEIHDVIPEHDDNITLDGEIISKKEFNSPTDETEDKDPFAVSRNAPCPCGSGKKYKYCHGRFA